MKRPKLFAAGACSVVLAATCFAAPQLCEANFTDCNGIVTSITATCPGCLPIHPLGQCYNQVTFRNPGQPNQCIQSVVIQCIECPVNGEPGGGPQ